MAKKKATGGQGSSKAKNTTKGKEKPNRPDGEFEKLLEEVDKPKAGKNTNVEKGQKTDKPKKEVKTEAKKEDKKQASIKAKADEKAKTADDEEDDDDEDDGNFSFVSMFLAIIAIVLAVKILLNYNDLSSKNRVLQDRVESIDEALDRNNANLEKKFAKLSAKLKVPVQAKDKKLAKKVSVNETLIANHAKLIAGYESKLNHLGDVVFTSNNFQAALELKSALDRLDDLSTWVTGASKKKVDDVRSKIIDLITSLEHGSDTWQPTVFRKGKFTAPKRVSSRPVRAPRKPMALVPSKRVKAARKVLPKRVAPARVVPRKPARPVPVQIKRHKTPVLPHANNISGVPSIPVRPGAFKNNGRAVLDKSAALRIQQQKAMILKKIEAAKKRQARVQIAKQKRAKAIMAKAAKQRQAKAVAKAAKQKIAKTAKRNKAAVAKKADPLDELFGAGSKKAVKSGNFEDLFGSTSKEKSDDDILDF